MVKIIPKNKSKITKTTKNKNKKSSKIKNKLFLISPFHFTKENFFFYEIKKISFFLKFINNWNNYKPNEDEVSWKKDTIDKIVNAKKDPNKKIISITPYFYSMISNLEKIPLIEDEIDKNLKEIIINFNKNHTISLKKLQELYITKTGKKLSITSINRRLKNNLKYNYKKISLLNQRN